jgi:hypothetical protein
MADDHLGKLSRSAKVAATSLAEASIVTVFEEISAIG